MPICINCGQCANVCPADSITEKVEAYEVAAAMRDPEKIVIFIYIRTIKNEMVLVNQNDLSENDVKELKSLLSQNLKEETL